MASYDKAISNFDKFNQNWQHELTQPVPSLTRCFVKTYGLVFAGAAVFKFLNDVCQFIGPLILSRLVDFIEDPEEDLYMGYIYTAAMFLSAVFQSIVLHQYFHICLRVGMHIRGAVVSTLYRKSLVIDSESRQNNSVGSIVNLMSVDAQRFMDMVAYLHMVWSAPFQIAVSIYLLYQEVGSSVFAGLSVMILMIPLNGVLATKLKNIQVVTMKEKDTRTKLINEVLNGIKIIKLYSWESSFYQTITEVRQRELESQRRTKYLGAITSFLWYATPTLVSITTFATYSGTGGDLTPSKAFTSLALFNLLRFPLTMLPMVISSIVESKVSVKRLSDFLLLPELNQENVQKASQGSKTAVRIHDGTFSWKRSAGPLLRSVNIEVESNQLVAVTGQVGAGKSSLMEAILGGMVKQNGYVQVNGSVAYVSQQAWIQNATLRDNILFGLPFDERRYARVLDACALKQDIDMLPAGDMTEIGEKGINLSGGQKQRVSIARAVYHNADVYLLDDPLSAVDAHVGKHIFENVISREKGMLKDKAVILVTHAVHFLPSVSRIYLLKEGEIAEAGTYQRLMELDGQFASLVKTYGVSEQAQPQDQTAEETKPNQTQEAPAEVKKGADTAGKKIIGIEERAVGEVNKDVYTTYFLSIGKTLAASIATVLILVQVSGISSNIWLSVWSEDEDNEDYENSFYIGIYVLLGTLQSIFVFLSAIQLAWASIISSATLHDGMLNTILRAPMAFFDTTPLGRIINRFGKDQYTVDDSLPRIVQSYLNTFMFVMGIMFVIIFATPYFVVIILPLSFLYRYVQQYYLATSRELKRLESTTRSPIFSHFSETLQGASTIRAYQLEPKFVDESDKRLDFNQAAYYPNVASNRWLAMRLEFLGTIIVTCACLFAVMERDSIDAGTVGLSISYALSVTQTLNWMVRMSCELEANIVSVERIKEYSELKTEAAAIVPSNRPASSWPNQGTIQLRNLSLRYREGLDLVLNRISCSINAKEKIGICGRTGAGKSSLTLALFRLVEPAEGTIVIDGVDISAIGLDDLRSKLSIIPQDPVLFSGTIRSNLDPFHKYTDAEVWEAVKTSHMYNYVSKLEKQLDSPVTENGDNFSVGQRQLLCLARALLRKSTVLVLDEATAAVDVETDALVQSTIRSAFKECTVLTIAHRINTIIDNDRVMVLDRGRLAEFDSPKNLLGNTSSIFYSLVNSSSH
eukprot:TRINITY_DN1266_c0_g1_i1.p1 TRINITY_DN1266_c0_g1~~TRINITY_DN1266_c0_g1_i1.p1  ORF type:complete len:1203 (-),score=279.41 TRINITY_DN1266_c0_g1_i1:2308-5916(-)